MAAANNAPRGPVRKALRVLLAALAVLLLAVAVGVAATWAPDLGVDELTGRWAAPPSRFVAVQGLSVHLRDEGPRNDPLPIVLLHGICGEPRNSCAVLGEIARGDVVCARTDMTTPKPASSDTAEVPP